MYCTYDYKYILVYYTHYRVCRILQLALTLPVGSVKYERSISVLRRVHYYARSKMKDNRLSELSLLAIERNILESLSNYIIIDKFVSSKRRIPL